MCSSLGALKTVPPLRVKPFQVHAVLFETFWFSFRRIFVPRFLKGFEPLDEHFPKLRWMPSFVPQAACISVHDGVHHSINTVPTREFFSWSCCRRPSWGIPGRDTFHFRHKKGDEGARLLVMEPLGGPGVTVAHLMPENTVCNLTLHTELPSRLKTTYKAN